MLAVSERCEVGLALRQPLEELPTVVPQAETGVLVCDPDPPLPLLPLLPPRDLWRALSSLSAALHSSWRSSSIPWISADSRSALTPTGALSWPADERVDVVVDWLLDCPRNPLWGLSVLLGRDLGFDSERGSELERWREAGGHLKKGKMLQFVTGNQPISGNKTHTYCSTAPMLNQDFRSRSFVEFVEILNLNQRYECVTR